MAALELLCRMADINPSCLSKEENNLLEAILFFSLCNEYSNYYDAQQNNNSEKETQMLNGRFIHSLLNDLLNSNTYTALGIATYTQIPEEVIYDIAMEKNTNPSLEVSRKIFELHRTAHSEIYQNVIKKIASFSLK